MNEKPLYSPPLKVRLEATQKLPTDSKPSQVNWPAGCRGALNAYLVLLGPSYGNIPPGEAEQNTHKARPKNSPACEGGTLFEFGGRHLFPYRAIPNQSVFKWPPLEVNFPGVGFPTLVLKAPRRPSRGLIDEESCNQIGHLVAPYENGQSGM